MTRAILVNENHNYISYGHQHQTDDNFETTPHATIETLIKAKRMFLPGATLYLWRFPCFECAKAIVYAGITKLVYKNDDRKDPTRSEAQLLLEHSAIEIVKNEELDF